jgi:MFS family permease
MVGPHRLPCEHPVAPGSIEATPADARWVLPATILGSSLSFIDGSVVNVALPVMQDSLGGSLATMQWVVNADMLTLASLAIVSAAYTEEMRGPAIGTWAAAGALTTSLGPPLGGWLVDTSLPGLIIVGVGMTLSVAPLTTTVFDFAPEDRSGTASRINNAAARAGGLPAIAALGLAFGSSGETGVTGSALADAYEWVMFSAAVLAGLSAFTAALTIRGRKEQPRGRQ